MAEQHALERAPEMRMVDRMLFFSDAVFAIVLTLLVLELRPPEASDDAGLAIALKALSPKFFAFAASFALVSIFWTAHMAITRRLAGSVIQGWGARRPLGSMPGLVE